MAADLLEIQLLGDFRIRAGERVIPEAAWKLRKAAAIVKLLALEPEHRLHREQLLEALWPELDPEAAANNFRYALHTARRMLDLDSLPQREGQHLTLGEASQVWVDVQAFESALDRAWRDDDPGAFQRAAALYTGDLLPADLYEEWLDERRAALRTSYLAALARLARLGEECGDTSIAIDTWQRVVASEPTQEEAHTRLMLLYARSGRRSEALAQYDRLLGTLRRELGVEPEPVTRQLAEAIRDGTLGEAPAAQRTHRKRRSTLPAQTTSLVGRDREIAEVGHVLSDTRLLALTGPGGVGKTRLALAVAEEEGQRFADGIFFVQLAPVGQPDFVASTIVQTVGIQDMGGQTPAETLIQFFGDRSILLVLDNFEHVIQAAPLVHQLLEACPGLTVLVTSRTPLHLRGERCYPLRSLADDASTTLFIHRARDVRLDFDPDEQQRAAIAEICLRLDRLPLAIELAAARSNILSPQALLVRLKHPLAVLPSGPRDLPDRQRTLRATIAWSYELLGPDERSLFQRLAVFRGGWSLDALEAFWPGDDDALSTLSALVDSSLAEQATLDDGEPHFRMLETIREFGLERLAASGDEHDVRSLHARYFAHLLEQTPPFLRGPDHPLWLNRLEQEHANMQAALDWFLTEDINAGLRMATLMWRFWWMRGHLTIGKRYFDQLLGLADDSVEPAMMAAALTGAGAMTEFESDLEWDRAIALHEQALSIWLDLTNPPEGAYWSYLCLGNLALRNTDLHRAKAFYDEAVEYADRHNQPYGRAGGLLLLGNLAAYQGDYEKATELFQASLALARDFRDPWMIAMNTNNLGVLLISEGRYVEASPLIREALELGRQLGHARDITSGLNNLGWIELRQGRISESAALFDEGFAVALQTNDARAIANAHYGLASVALRLGDPDRAVELFRQSLHGNLAAGEPIGTAGALEGLASAYSSLGEHEHASTLYASVAAYRARVGIPLTGVDQRDVEQGLTALQEALPEAGYRKAWDAGLVLTPEDISSMEDARAGRPA